MADETRAPSPADARARRERATPAGASFHEDNPQEDWGEPAAEGAAYGANHLTRGDRTDAERGPGRKTLRANKDIVSKRGP